MKKISKTVFCCQACGYQTPKWMGKCLDCGEWHTFMEETQTLKRAPGIARSLSSPQIEPVPIDSIELKNENRLLTGIKEFDRVLGGGIVSGSLVLIGGDPGIGKSLANAGTAMTTKSATVTLMDKVLLLILIPPHAP